MDADAPFILRVSALADATVLTLRGDWDLYAKDELHAALASLGTASDVAIDVRAASFFDSTALAEFVTFFKRLTARGKRFELLVGGSNIGRILEVTGLSHVLVPVPDRLAYLEEHLPVDNTLLKPP